MFDNLNQLIYFNKFVKERFKKEIKDSYNYKFMLKFQDINNNDIKNISCEYKLINNKFDSIIHLENKIYQDKDIFNKLENLESLNLFIQKLKKKDEYY